jgi:hypothetical protein
VSKSYFSVRNNENFHPLGEKKTKKKTWMQSMVKGKPKTNKWVVLKSPFTCDPHNFHWCKF